MDRRDKMLAVLALAFGCASGTLLQHSFAKACSSLAPPPVLVGSPSNGDTNVPTDVVPFYDTTSAELDLTVSSTSPANTIGGKPQFELVSAGGDTIPLAVDSTHAWALEFTPQSPLQPNTRYTLSGAWTTLSGTSATGALTFTTGAGPVLAPPPAPKAFLQRYIWDRGPVKNDCDPNAQGTCVAIAANTIVEATYIDNLGQDWLPRYLYSHPYLDSGIGPGAATPYVCVRLRERAPNGTFGDPTVLCASDAPLISFAGSAQFKCTSEGLTQDGLLLPVDGGGSSGGVEGGVLPDGAADPGSPAGATPATRGGASTRPVAKGGCSVASGVPDAPPPWTLVVGSIVLAAGVRIASRRKRT